MTSKSNSVSYNGCEKTSSEIFFDFKMTSAVTQRNILETASKILSQNSNYSKIETSDINSKTNVNKLLLQNDWDKTWSEYHREICRRIVPPKRLDYLRNVVKEAVKEHKVFYVYGNYTSIKKALLDRGWLEKCDVPTESINIANDDDIYSHMPIQGPSEHRSVYSKRCEKRIMTYLLRDVVPDFCWNYRLTYKDVIGFPKNTLVNRLLYARFSTKAGLCNILKHSHWFTDPQLGEVNFPRCYIVNDPEQQEEFLDDFRLTASISLLRTFEFMYKTGGSDEIVSSDGDLPLNTITMAIQICYRYLLERKNEDIDSPKLYFQSDNERLIYLDNCYQFVHKNGKFFKEKDIGLPFLEKAVSNILTDINQYSEQVDIDGRLNIWIMKPAARCRGIGIRLMSNYKEIITMLNDIINKGRYVCQKYIETPLLIHGHKFDIRQWFLVTSVQPLTVWIYKECYLRFSSKQFDLNDYHEIIHLTNNAVQNKYKNIMKNKQLPVDNMWEVHEFKNYLESIGNAGIWDRQIYPQIKRSIIGALLCSEQYIDTRTNCFQMFGADLMIDNNFNVWLIEINSCPQMAPTSSVTSKLCPQCFEDVVKVVVDRRIDSCANTGQFELVYKPQNVKTFAANHFVSNLEVVGKKMTVHKDILIDVFNKYRPVLISTASQILKNCTSDQTLNMIDNYKVNNCSFIDLNITCQQLENVSELNGENTITIESVTTNVNENINSQKLREIEAHYEKIEKLNVKRVYNVHIGKPILAMEKNLPKYQKYLSSRNGKTRKKILNKNSSDHNKEQNNSSISDGKTTDVETPYNDAHPPPLIDILRCNVNIFETKLQENFLIKSVKLLYFNTFYKNNLRLFSSASKIIEQATDIDNLFENGSSKNNQVDDIDNYVKIKTIKPRSFKKIVKEFEKMIPDIKRANFVKNQQSEATSESNDSSIASTKNSERMKKNQKSKNKRINKCQRKNSI